MPWSQWIIGIALISSLSACVGTYRGSAATSHFDRAAAHPIQGKLHWSLHRHGVIKVAGQFRGLTPHAHYQLVLHQGSTCSSPYQRVTPASAAAPAPDWPVIQANAHGLAIVQLDLHGWQMGHGPHDIRALYAGLHAQSAGMLPPALSCARLQRKRHPDINKAGLVSPTTPTPTPPTFDRHHGYAAYCTGDPYTQLHNMKRSLLAQDARLHARLQRLTSRQWQTLAHHAHLAGHGLNGCSHRCSDR